MCVFLFVCGKKKATKKTPKNSKLWLTALLLICALLACNVLSLLTCNQIEFPLTIYGVERDFGFGDLEGKTVVNDGIVLLGNPGHLVFHSFDDLPEATYYWYLPEQFAGDQVRSKALL